MSVTKTMSSVKVVDCTDTINARLQERAQYLTEFNAGRDAFQRREFPQSDWCKAKQAGWDFAGELANLAATAAPASVQERWVAQEECEYLPLSDEPGYLESLQPWLY